MSGDDRDRYDRPSWREIDRMRSGTQRRDPRDRRPHGKAAEERAAAATTQYLREVDKHFAGAKDVSEGAELESALRDAHGTPALADACRAYRDAVGLPSDPALLGFFLDSGEPELVVAALDALLEAQTAGSLEIRSGLKSQLRVLAEGFDDDVASRAEELLEES
jgi:hypothetical protein